MAIRKGCTLYVEVSSPLWKDRSSPRIEVNSNNNGHKQCTIIFTNNKNNATRSYSAMNVILAEV